MLVRASTGRILFTVRTTVETFGYRAGFHDCVLGRQMIHQTVDSPDTTPLCVTRSAVAESEASSPSQAISRPICASATVLATSAKGSAATRRRGAARYPRVTPDATHAPRANVLTNDLARNRWYGFGSRANATDSASGNHFRGTRRS